MNASHRLASPSLLPLLFCLGIALPACQGALESRDATAPQLANPTPPTDSPSLDPSRPDSPEEEEDPASEDRDPMEMTPPDLTLAPAEPGALGMRRLTSSEYVASVRLAMPSLKVELPVIGGDVSHGELVINDTGVDEQVLFEYQRVAEQISQAFVEDNDANAGCSPSYKASCFESWLDHTGPLLWRRPLEAEERADLVTLFNEVKQATSKGRLAWRAAIESLLLSPNFLYVVPRGEREDALVKLDGPSMATRLSFLLLGRGPDEALLEEARAGALDTEQGILQVARRLMQSEEGRRALSQLYLGWLGVDASREFYLEDQAMVGAMRQETERLVTSVIEERSGSLEALLLADYTYMNAAIAGLYGVTLPEGTGKQEWVRVSLKDLPRQGVLTHPSVLHVQSHGNSTDSPLFRGLFLRERLLCLPRPQMAPDGALEAQRGETARERSQYRLESPTCKGCHNQMDPLGLPFLGFDVMGRVIEQDEKGNALDLSADIVGVGEMFDGPVEGVEALTERLVDNDLLHACLSQRIYATTFLKADFDATSDLFWQSLTRRFRHQDDVEQLLLDMIASRAFRYMKRPE